MNISDFINYIDHLYASYGYIIVFLSSFLEISPAGWLVPGGLMLAAGGFFAYSNNLSLVAMLIFGWTGAWTVFLLAYYFGITTGDQFIKTFKQEKNAERAEILLKKHGAVILTTSMLASITRFWVAYVAGIKRYKFSKFLVFSGLASLTWSSLMIVIGYLAGSERQELEKSLGTTGIISWTLLVVAVGVIYWVIRKELKNEETLKEKL